MSIETEAATADPPAAPATASVVLVLVELAFKFKSLAPVKAAEVSIEAMVWKSTVLRAKEAPIPKSLPLAGCFGVARVVFDVFADDCKLKLAPFALTVALGSMNDRVLTMVVLMANEPAMPKSPEALVLVGPETASSVFVGFKVAATIETALPSRLDTPPTDDNASASTVWIATLTPIPDVLF